MMLSGNSPPQIGGAGARQPGVSHYPPFRPPVNVPQNTFQFREQESDVVHRPEDNYINTKLKRKTNCFAFSPLGGMTFFPRRAEKSREITLDDKTKGKWSQLNFLGPMKQKGEINLHEEVHALKEYINKLKETAQPIKSQYHEITYEILKELLNVNVTNLFSSEHREILNILNLHFEEAVQHAPEGSYDVDYDNFTMELDYLKSSLSTEALSAMAPSESLTWDFILFSSLLLNSKGRFDSEISKNDAVLRYIEANFAAGYPTHTLAMLKLGRLDKIFGDPVFLHRNFPFFILVLLNLYDKMVVEQITSILEGIIITLAEHTRTLRDLNIKLDVHILILCSILALSLKPQIHSYIHYVSGSHQREIIHLQEILLLRHQMVAVHRQHGAGHGNLRFDNEVVREFYRYFLPAMLLHIDTTLIPDGAITKGLGYMNWILEAWQQTPQLAKHQQFVVALREHRERLVKLHVVLEERRTAGKEQPSFSIQKDIGKNLLGFFGNAFGKLVKQTDNLLKGNSEVTSGGNLGSQQYENKPNSPVKPQEQQQQRRAAPKEGGESNFYYDKNLGQWIINGRAAEEIEQEEKKKVKPPPPVDDNPPPPPPPPGSHYAPPGSINPPLPPPHSINKSAPLSPPLPPSNFGQALPPTNLPNDKPPEGEHGAPVQPPIGAQTTFQGFGPVSVPGHGTGTQPTGVRKIVKGSRYTSNY